MSEEIKVREHVEELAGILRKEASIDENGKVTFNKDAFDKCLPEGMTRAQVRAVDTLKQDIALAQGLVTGDLGLDYMKKHKQVETIESKLQLPVGNIVAVVHREGVKRNVSTGEETKVPGHIAIRLTTKVPGSQLAAVRSIVSAKAKKFGL